MEVSKNEENEETSKLQVDMPDVTNISLKEAKSILKELGLDYEADTEDAETIIKEQLPKKGIKVNQGTKVYLYCN